MPLQPEGILDVGDGLVECALNRLGVDTAVVVGAGFVAGRDGIVGASPRDHGHGDDDGKCETLTIVANIVEESDRICHG